jgi:hypothetical protein
MLIVVVAPRMELTEVVLVGLGVVVVGMKQSRELVVVVIPIRCFVVK